jgi:hypothetical protein
LPRDSAQALLFDDFYKLPIVTHSSVDAFAEQAIGLAIHLVHSDGLRIPVLGNLFRGEQLNVGFHGSIDRATKRIPVFERRSWLARRPDPFIVIADPSLELAPELTLAWYTGTDEADIVPTLRKIVRAAGQAVGASRTLLIGNSGGGFAALQVGRESADCVSVVFAPQIEVVRFHAQIVRQYLQHCFPGTTIDSALAAHPTRLSAATAYRQGHRNLVRYVQNTGDSHHLRSHYSAFREAVNGDGRSSADGRVAFVALDLGRGHIAPSSALVAEQVSAAERMLAGSQATA